MEKCHDNVQRNKYHKIYHICVLNELSPFEKSKLKKLRDIFKNTKYQYGNNRMECCIQDSTNKIKRLSSSMCTQYQYMLKQHVLQSHPSLIRSLKTGGH